MRRFVRFVDRLSDACAVFAAAMLIASTLIVCWMVAYRAMGNSTFWEIELATYFIVAAVLVGSPFCLKTRGHIGVDLVSEFLPARPRRLLFRVLAVLGLCVCVFLAWEGLKLTYEAWLSGERSGSSWNPYLWPFYATMPIGLGLTALQYVADFCRPDEPADPPTSQPSGQGA